MFRNIIVGSTPEAVLLRGKRDGFTNLNINLTFSNNSSENLVTSYLRVFTKHYFFLYMFHIRAIIVFVYSDPTSKY